VNLLIYPFEKILHAASVVELTTAIQDATYKFGFSSFHYGAHAPVKSNGERARFIFDGTEQKHGGVISSYPESWFDRYQSQNYIEIDPLVTHCSKSIIPVVWHQQEKSANKTVLKMFDEATEHGLVAGATFSVIGKNSELAIFSLTSEHATESEKRNILAQLGQGYMLLAHIHEAVTRLGLSKNHFTESIVLTKREKECLSWVSIGKTSWEISKILGIAEATIIFHIGNASRKLQTNTRTSCSKSHCTWNHHPMMRVITLCLTTYKFL
jgi:DNA-binding CsgD family transcriptional regulator